MMPTAKAGAGLFISSIFVLIFSTILFKERIGWRRIVAVLIGTFGVLLVLQPGHEGFSFYHTIQVIARAYYAIGSIITYRYLRDESPLAIVMGFIFSISACGALATTTLAVFPMSTELLLQALFLFKE